MTERRRPNKPRTDSHENMLRVFAGANIEIAPPPHMALSDDDLPHFRAIIDEQAKADWTPHNVEMAAFLARTMSDLEAAQRQLAKEGPTVTRADGSIRPHPLHGVVRSFIGMTLAIRRSLGLSARIRAGGSTHAAKQRIQNRNLERSATATDDNLLA